MNITEVAGGVIRNATGELLLLHRNQPHLSQWELPGGKVEPNENPENTVVRELHEELGINVSILNKLGAQKFEQLGQMWRYHWYMVSVVSGEPAILEPHLFDEVKFWHPDTIKDHPDMSPNVLNLIDRMDNSHL